MNKQYKFAQYDQVSRALAIGAVPFGPAAKTSDIRKRSSVLRDPKGVHFSNSSIVQTLNFPKKNREEEMAMGLEYEVGTIGTDIIMLQEDIKMVSQQNSKYFFCQQCKGNFL